MNSAQFQGSAKSTPFAPLQAPDQTGAMRQQLNDQLRWMREDQQMVIDDRRQYAAALDRQMRSNQDFREKDLEYLAGMSKTLTDTLLQVKKDYDKNQMEEGLMLFYETGLPLEQVEQFDKDEAELIKARDATNEFAGRQARNGAPPEIVEKIRNLSGWKRYGYLTGLAQDAGLKWGEYLNNALETDNETQVDLGNGLIITPAGAKDKAQMAAVTSVLRKKFMRDQGLTGANPALLNKYLFPNMKQGEDTVIRQRHAAMVAAQSEATMDEQDGILTTALRSQGDPGVAFNAYVSNLRAVFDPKTKTALGPGGARDRGIAVIEALAKDGQINPEVLDKIEQSLIPGSTTETWGSKFPQKFLGLRDSIRAGKEADLAAQDREEARAEKDQEEQLIAYAEQKGGLTEAEKEEIRSSYQLRGKPLPAAIDNLLTVEQKSDAAAREYLDSVLASGRGLTMQELMGGGYSPKIINAYKGQVQQFELSVKNNETYKTNKAALEQLLQQNLLQASAPGTRPDWTLKLAQAKAAELLQTETLKNVRNGMSPSEAAEAAMVAVKKQIDAGLPKNGGIGIFKMAADPNDPTVAKVNGGYTSLITGSLAQAQSREAEMRRIRAKVTAYRAGARFLDQPLISEQDLQMLERLRTNPNAGFPASVLYLASETRNLSPWDVADRQLQAANRDPLTKPPAVQWSDSIDPRLRQILNFSPSFRRTGRAFAGSEWNPSKIPNGYGAIVERAAAANGIEPALLAGLLATESSWINGRVSRAGAMGLGQLMPGTARELGVTNPNDPVQNINGAARYLKQMMGMFNGDITSALRAYNQGPGNQQRFPGGVSDEARSYPMKVLREAAKYGYGYGQGSPFRRQELMNPRLAYRIGSLGYKSTGPHLDVKPVVPGTTRTDRNLPAYRPGTLDPYVLVKRNGKLVPLSKGSTSTDNDAAHRARGSFGHDYAAPDGTEVYLRNGARVVGTFKGDQGTDHTIIELPDGRRFQFLHGRNA